MKNDNKLKVGLAHIGQKDLNLELSTVFTGKLIDEIKKLGLSVSGNVKPIETDTDAIEAVNKFKKDEIDVLLIVNGTWTNDEIGVRLASTDVPIMMWSIPEPLTGRFVELASLVGLTQNGSTLGRLGYKLEVAAADFNDKNSLDKLKKLTVASSIVRKIRNARLGFIGNSGSPGMLDTEFNQLTLKKRLGSDVIRITIEDFIEKIKKIKDTRVEKVITELNPLMPPPPKELDIKFKECIKIFIAIKDWVTEENIDAFAFRCWPELKDLGIYCPCLGLSLISSMGIQASCEGDIPGALSMLLLSSLSQKPSYLSDLTRIEEKEKVIYYFHCGAAAPQLAGENTICYKTHTYSAWNPGITVEFPLKPGPITFARIEELLDGSYMLITYSGEAVQTDMVCAGNPMKAKFAASPIAIVKKLVNSGSGHHQVCTYGNFTKELKIIAEMLGIKFIEAER